MNFRGPGFLFPSSTCHFWFLSAWNFQSPNSVVGDDDQIMLEEEIDFEEPFVTVMENASLNLLHGTMVGIVGKIGSGKTSLLRGIVSPLDLSPSCSPTSLPPPGLPVPLWNPSSPPRWPLRSFHPFLFPTILQHTLPPCLVLQPSQFDRFVTLSHLARRNYYQERKSYCWWKHRLCTSTSLVIKCNVKR